MARAMGTKKEYSTMLDEDAVDAIEAMLDRGDSRSALINEWMIRGAVQDDYLDDWWLEEIGDGGDQEASGDE